MSGVKVSQATVEASEALLRRTAKATASLNGFLRHWHNLLHIHDKAAHLRLINNTMEDTWCCAVLPYTPYIQDNRYPPCLPHTLRVIRREMLRKP